MKRIYFSKKWLLLLFFAPGFFAAAQVPTVVGPGFCEGVIANFNTNDNGYNSPSIYAGMFDSSFYFNASRGYWTDYLPPSRVLAPGAPRVIDIISPPYINPNQVGTFNVGFAYIVNNPLVDRFQVRIISVNSGVSGTTTNVEATSGPQFFSNWSTPVPYLVDTGANPSPFFVGFSGNVCIRLVDPDITNASNTMYRVEIAYIVNEPFFTMIDNLSIGPSNIPLPVNFIGLVANRDNADVDLRWDVSEEVNVREYQVERSDNGASFSSVGTVSAKGKSVYSFVNYNVSPYTQFYRVKSVDIDGHIKYSGILRLPGNSSSSFSDRLVVYPVPAGDEIMVEHGKVRDAKLVITSVDGRVMKTVVPANGSSHTPVNVSSLRPGLYLLRLENEMGKVITTKLVKN